MAESEAVDIVGHDGGTVVAVFDTEGDIIERDAVGVAQVETPGGELFPHGEFGVASFPFGDGGQLVWIGAAIGVGSVSMSRKDYLGILESDVLYAHAGSAGDDSGGDVAGLVFDGAFVGVAGIGFGEGYFGIEVLDDDIAEAGLLGGVGVARSEPQEEGVARVDAAEAVDNNVLYDSPVDTGGGESAAVGVVDEYVVETEVAEDAAGDGAELDTVGTAAADAVLHKDVLGEAVFAVALEAEGIVGSIVVAVAYDDITAVHDVHTVVVPVAFAVHGLVFYQKMSALVVLLVPTGWIAEGDATDGDIVALAEVDILGTVGFVGAVVFEGVLYQTEVYEVDGVVGHLPAAAVDGAFAGDGDVVLLDGKEEGCPAAVRVFDVVEGVERAEKGGTAVEM